MHLKNVILATCVMLYVGMCCGVNAIITTLYLTLGFHHYCVGVHTKEAMRSYKALASYKLLESGWVLTVLHTRQPHSDVTIFKADVVPSFRVNDTPHHPWAGVNQVGDVVATHCDCKAGYVSLFVYLTICIPIEQCKVN